MIRFNEKIVTFEKFSYTLQVLRSHDRKIIFTNGCFDILHYGHCMLFKFCKELYTNSVLVVGLNNDKSVKLNKGKDRPYNNVYNRTAVLASISFVDYIIPFKEKSVLNLIKLINPDVLVKGAEYEEKDIIGANHVKKYGGIINRFTMIDGISSTNIIEKLNEKRD